MNRGVSVIQSDSDYIRDNQDQECEEQSVIQTDSDYIRDPLHLSLNVVYFVYFMYILVILVV